MKHLQARPWLVALATVTAALAAITIRYTGRPALVPLDATLPAAPVYLFVALAAVGIVVLALQPLARRARHAHAGVAPTLSDLPELDASPVDAPETALPESDPSPAAGEFRLTIDAQGRIAACEGSAAVVLAENPPELAGHSLLELIPGRIRSSVVDAVREARSRPGEAETLPMLRLQGLTADGGTRPTRPLKLSLTGHPNGTVTVHGRALGPASPAAAGVGAGDDRFSRVFHSSPDAILIYRHRDGVVIDFNQSFTRLLGFTREQGIGAPAQDLQLWMDEVQRGRVAESFATERSLTDVEAQLRHRNGQAVPVELSLRFIELDGELSVLCIARDISRRLEAELAARRSDERLSQVFSQSPDGILILRRRDLVVQDANEAFLRGSGFSAEALIGQPASIFNAVFTQPGDLERIVDTIDAEGRVANLEMRLRSIQGREMNALVSGLLTEIDGEPSLLCIIKDISDLRHIQEQLRRSEERFRGAFENAPIGILLLDPLGHIFQANRFAAELLNYGAGALDNVHVSRLVPPDERGDLKEQLERLLRGNESALRSERRMLCEDGLEIWTNCHVVLQRGSDGEALYAIMQIADITEMKTSQRRMERLAFYDTLTELANRRLFNDRLQQAVEHCRRHDSRAALLYLDLDQFKRVNDTLGHESGDALLKEVATRLLRCVRKEDTVGRPGGDEFTILLCDLEAPSHAGRVADKILRALEQPITLAGHHVVVTTSIGITVIPDDGEEPNALTKNADLAMYRAKEKGRNNYQFFSEELNTNAVQRLRTEYELRRALERSEFELHYQPTVRIADETIVGVECLLRWNHPERGLVPPDEFIGIAEETGAIVEIGNWVIQQACAAGRLMADQHGAPLNIAVNISPRQFRDPHLVETIRRSLRQAHLEPGRLEVEITETMLMHDVEAAAEILQRLHRLGIRLAIDDFGTGYSSLNYLKKFPISTIKVDRTFITDIPESSDDMEITAAVIAMAHRLRMHVVAEGVETRDQVDFLKEQHCDFAQGFLFSRALPLHEVGRLLGTANGQAAAATDSRTGTR